MMTHCLGVLFLPLRLHVAFTFLTIFLLSFACLSYFPCLISILSSFALTLKTYFFELIFQHEVQSLLGSVHLEIPKDEEKNGNSMEGDKYD